MTLIKKTKDLIPYCKSWLKNEFITVDTEFLRTNTYYAKLCLIQVSCKDGALAIDPLSPEMDLTPFYEVLQHDSVTKVFHAARQDVEIFYQQADVVPQPLFDTQLAAMVCGYGDSASYQTLVASVKGHKLDKSQQFTNWSKRPLSKKQLSYALDDVIHLRDVYEDLKKNLDVNGRETWLREETRILLDPKTYDLNPKDAWRKIRSKNTNRRYLSRIKVLAEYREKIAQKKNVPRNRVYSNRDITTLAAVKPETLEELQGIPNIPGHIKNGPMGKDILKLLKKVRDIPKDNLPALPRKITKGRAPKATVDLLKVLLKHRCAKHGVAPRLVATSPDIEEFAKTGSRDIPFMKGWRYDLYGKDAEALLKGKLAISSNGEEIQTAPLKPKKNQ